MSHANRSRDLRVVAEVAVDQFHVYAEDREFFGPRGGAQHVVGGALALYGLLPRKDRLAIAADQHPRNREEMRRMALMNNPFGRALFCLAKADAKTRDRWIEEMEEELGL